MRREIENLKTEEELENELMALKLKMALRQYQEDKLARMMAEHDDDAAGKERLANGQDEMIRRIDRQLRKRQARRFARKTLPRFGKIAACLLLTFYVGLTVAVAAVQSVRVELLQFILSIEEKYTSFGFESTDEYMREERNTAYAPIRSISTAARSVPLCATIPPLPCGRGCVGGGHLHFSMHSMRMVRTLLRTASLAKRPETQ